MKGHQLYGPHSHDYLKSLIFSALLSESVLTLLSFCDELHIAPHSKTGFFYPPGNGVRR